MGFRAGVRVAVCAVNTTGGAAKHPTLIGGWRIRLMTDPELPAANPRFPATTCSAIAGERLVLLFLFQTDDQLASRVPLFQISDRPWHLTQAVLPVDDRHQLSSLHEVAQSVQIVRFVRVR